MGRTFLRTYTDSVNGPLAGRWLECPERIGKKID